MCLENILHISVVTKDLRITICRFTAIRFTKNYNLQGFKELQYVDLQLDLQRTTTWKVVKCFFNHLNTFNEVPQHFFDLHLICWLTSLRASFIWTSGNVTSIVSVTPTVIFSKQEFSRRRVARSSPGENKCLWNSGKIKQL